MLLPLLVAAPLVLNPCDMGSYWFTPGIGCLDLTFLSRPSAPIPVIKPIAQVEVIRAESEIDGFYDVTIRFTNTSNSPLIYIEANLELPNGEVRMVNHFGELKPGEVIEKTLVMSLDRFSGQRRAFKLRNGFARFVGSTNRMTAIDFQDARKELPVQRNGVKYE